MPATLHLGDCLEVMPTLPAGSVDAIIADWPYGVTSCKWDSVIPLEPLWKECKRVIKPKGAIVLTASQPFTSVLVMSNLDWFKYEWVWEKDNSSNPSLCSIQPLRYHETVIIFYKEQCTYNPQMWDAGFVSNKSGINGSFGMAGKQIFMRNNSFGTTLRFPKTIIKFNKPKANTEGGLHPTQKPVKLLEYLIKTYTNPGDLVLDNTFGSCSTGEACLRTGRRFIGIEKDEGYFEIGKARMERVEEELRQAQIAKEHQPYLMNVEVVS